MKYLFSNKIFVLLTFIKITNSIFRNINISSFPNSDSFKPIEGIQVNEETIYFLSEGDYSYTFSINYELNSHSSLFNSFLEHQTLNKKESPSIKIDNLYYAKACVTFNNDDNSYIIFYEYSSNLIKKILLDENDKIKTKCSIDLSNDKTLIVSYLTNHKYIVKVFDNINYLSSMVTYNLKMFENTLTNTKLFNCIFSNFYLNIYCSSGKINGYEIYFQIYNKIKNINSFNFEVKYKSNINGNPKIIYTIFKKFNETLFYTISLMKDSIIEIDSFIPKDNNLILYKYLYLETGEDYNNILEVESAKINDKSIIVYIYFDKEVLLTHQKKFYHSLYLFDIQQLYYVDLTLNNFYYTFNDITNPIEYYPQLISSSTFWQIFFTFTINNSNNKDLFFFSFKRPNCINKKLNIRVYSITQINLFDLTEDTIYLYYKIKIANNNNNLICFDSSNQIIDCKMHLSNSLKYECSSPITKDTIYYFLIKEDISNSINQLYEGINYEINNVNFQTPSDLCKIEINVINCYINCKTCEKLGDENTQYCTSCLDNYILENGNCIPFNEY